MVYKAQLITGRVLKGLVGFFLIGASGIPKFLDWPGKEEMMGKMGIPLALLCYQRLASSRLPSQCSTLSLALRFWARY
jgi:hypothetical protein